MKTAIAIAGTAAVLALAGCSSSSPTPTPGVTASASPQASMIGPIIAGPDQTQVAATVGRFVVFNVGDNPGRWDIATENPEVVSVAKGGERDGATFNPGAQALSVGTATVTLTDTEGNLDALEYTITVTQ